MRWEGIEEVVAVADKGTFVAAAAHLGISKSHMSRAVQRLECRIGAAIFARTTRQISITPAGRILIERFRRLIDERNEAIASVNDNGAPRGEIRITCSVSLGERFVAAIVRDFAADYKAVAIDLNLSNKVFDLVADGYDLAIRTGTLPDSSLIATRIASRGLHLCASPAYADQHGFPDSLESLASHNCLIGSSSTWHFSQGGIARTFKPTGRWRSNNGTVVADGSVAGLGVCQLPDFYVLDHLRSGELLSLLEDLQPPEEPIWAVYSQRRHLEPKIRLLVDRLRRDLPPVLCGRDKSAKDNASEQK